MNDKYHFLVKRKNDKGNSKVLFSCHPCDYERYFNKLADDILDIQDCSIYYLENQNYFPEDLDDYKVQLSEFNLFVFPITYNFLAEENRAKDIDFKYAIENKYPVLPIIVEPNLYDLFNEFNTIQALDKTTNDPTQDTYKLKLEKYINSVLVDAETLKKIKNAFDAYIFLSYRKKDRKYAQEIMSLIHKNDFMRDIAIWYDEFLTPGEAFNNEISVSLLKSKLMTLVVTPNINDKGNYVIEEEYPCAVKENKPVLPIEAVETDREELRNNFKDIQNPISKDNGEEISKFFKDFIVKNGLDANDNDPDHLYFIGLAYLNGIDTDRDLDKAVDILEKAANQSHLLSNKFLMNFYYENNYFFDNKKSYDYAVKSFEIVSEALSKNEGKYSIDDLIDITSKIIKRYNISNEKKYEVINTCIKSIIASKNKDKLVSFCLFAIKNCEHNFSNPFWDPVLKFVPDVFNKNISDYYELAFEIANIYEPSPDDYDKNFNDTYSFIACEKAKKVSNNLFLKYTTLTWRKFISIFYDDISNQIEEYIKPTVIEMLSDDYDNTIISICDGAIYDYDDELFLSDLMDTYVLNNTNEICKNFEKHSSKFISALSKLLYKSFHVDDAKRLIDEYIKFIEIKHDKLAYKKLLEVSKEWDRSFLPWDRLINLYIKYENTIIDKECLPEFKRVVKYMCLSADIIEFGKLQKLISILGNSYDYYDNDKVIKYDNYFDIALNLYTFVEGNDSIKNCFHYLIGLSINGYQNSEGMANKAAFYKEKYEKIKEKV